MISAMMRKDGEEISLEGDGNGSIDAFSKAVSSGLGVDVRVLDYHEHAIGAGADAKAVTYMELQVQERELWGVGIHTDIVTASLRAMVSGVNRGLELG